MGERFSSYNALGRTWTSKSFLRGLVCVILINLVMVLFYFFRPSPFAFTFSAADREAAVGQSEEHQLVANLMSHVLKTDSPTDGITEPPVTVNSNDDNNNNGSPNIRHNLWPEGLRSRSYVSKNAAVVPKDAGGMTPKGANVVVLKDTDVVTKYAGVVPKITNTVLKDSDVVPKDSDVVAKDADVVAKDTGVVPKDADVVLKDAGVVDGNAERDFEFSDVRHEDEGIDKIIERQYLNRQKPRRLEENLEDPDHPQFSHAFPKHKKPLDLLNWTHSDESHLHFQTIDNQEAWVYSAFYDNRDRAAQVKVFGITHRELTGQTFCRYIGLHGELLDHQKGHLKRMKDTHGAKYAAMEVLCPATGNLQPAFMTITFTRDPAVLTNKIRVQYRGDFIRNFTVCFPPFHSNFSQSAQIVQIIEFNRILGANHFFIYNFSMSPNVDLILQQYQSDGLVSILPWPLPIMDTWYYGQILAINDCIYRNRGISRFVVITDTDEVVIPHIHLTWDTLLQNVVKHAWQRDDEFTDKDLKLDPEDENYRPGAIDEDILKAALKKAGRTGEQKKAGRKRERDVLKESNFHIDASSEEYSVLHKGLDNFKSSVISERNRDEFPSKYLQRQHASRHLMATDDDVKSLDSVQLKFGSFSFRCAFFNIKPLKEEHVKELQQSFSFSQQEKDLFAQLPRCPMMSLMRTDTINEHGERSKMIVQPDLVLYCGIHKVNLHIEGYTTAYVEPEVALLHHYREYQMSNSKTLDTSALVFKDQFYQSVYLAMKKFSSIVFS